MNTKQLRIVFMGTPEFAVSILREILQSSHEVIGVITAPDKPAGRGRKLSESAVKTFANQHNLKILQPTNLKDSEFVEELSSLRADIFVVVAFRMLPKVVWSMPKLGTINLHASLLPNYRGAAPINWAIINGETKTGVTTFFIEEKIDTGKIIERRELSIGSDETVGSLHDRLMDLGGTTVISTLDKIANQKYEAIDQNDLPLTNLRQAPKIFKEDCEIDFKKTSIEVHNFCRGLDPYPGAWIELLDIKKDEFKKFKLFESKLTDIKSDGNSSITLGENGINFPCSDKFISFGSIQMEGKRKMSAKEFSIGNTIGDYALRD